MATWTSPPSQRDHVEFRRRTGMDLRGSSRPGGGYPLRMRKPWITGTGLAIALQLGLAAAAAGQAVTARAAGDRAARAETGAALADLRALSADSMEGRRTGSEGAERARRYIEARLASIGVQPIGGNGYRQSFLLPAGQDPARREGINLVGRVPGRDPGGRVIVVTAHYDHVGVLGGQIFNGADDNASGVAALLEVARSLVSDPPLHTVVLAALDSEESGLQGARAFVTAPPVKREDIAIDLNFDMVGRNEAGELWVAGTHHYPSLRPFVEGLAASPGITLRIGHDRADQRAGEDWTGQSDHAAFHAAGIPFLYFGVENHADYHRPTDDFERIEPRFFMAAVGTLIGAVRGMDRALDRVVPRRPR